MTTFTIDDIRSWNPCYDPSRHLPESWKGTALDLLSIETIPPADRLWVVLREELIDARTLRLFAVWCARSVLHLANDPRCVAACDTAERFANGEATREELDAAWVDWAVMAAAREAAWEAARAAAGEAAGAAVMAAAREAAREAAWEAARAAVMAAVRDAAGDATWDAVRDAAWAAARAAGVAAREAQVARLRAMLSEPSIP